MTEHWRSTGTIAWTERDGAGRAPWAPGAAVWLAVAAALTAVLGVILFSDTLCPEHRTWVQVLGMGSILAAGASVAGIARHSTWAPMATVAAACGGVGIGLVDAVHAPGRGWLVASLFACVAAGSAVLAARQLVLARWERAVVDPLLAAPTATSASVSPRPDAPADPSVDAAVAAPVDAPAAG